MVEVPAVTPVTIPLEEPTEALALLLVHVPPPPSASVDVAATHALVVPVIEEGEALTVTVTNVKQPELSVYVIFEVPAVTPETIPVPEPAAALELLLVHVPPPASVREVVWPVHTDGVPEIEDGNGFTVTPAVT